MKPLKPLLGASLLSSIAASLCCITPVLAIISGISGIASTFSWLDLFRPYFLTITAVLLGFAWFRVLKTGKKQTDCGCEDESKKKGFLNTKAFLAIVTVSAISLSAFPFYSKILFTTQKTEEIVVQSSGTHEKILVNIEGLTCQGCEAHVNSELSAVPGITELSTSYKEGNSKISFDPVQVSADSIISVIRKTGYTVSDYTSITN